MHIFFGYVLAALILLAPPAWAAEPTMDETFDMLTRRLGQMQLALEPHDHAQLGSAGEFYSKWNMPAGGQPRNNSCCSMHDCYATAIKNVGGTWFGRHRETGRWVVIPDSKLEELQPDERESPDGQSHMCANPNGVVYCAVRGDGI